MQLLGTPRRRHRSRRGSRALRRAARRSSALMRPRAGIAKGAEEARRIARGNRLPGAGPPVLRARRARDDELLERGRAQRVRRSGDRGCARRGRHADAPHRPVPEERHRGRRRLRLRRPARRDRRRDAAHRGGGRPLGRLDQRPAAPLARSRRGRTHRGSGAGARARARRGRPDERAVRGQGQRGLRAGGEPPRIAHGAVRFEGDGAAAGEDRREGHGRQDARRARRVRRTACRPTSRSRRASSRSRSSRASTPSSVPRCARRARSWASPAASRSPSASRWPPAGTVCPTTGARSSA